MRKRSYEDTVERALIKIIRPKRARPGEPPVPELSADQKIKALAVAVRFAAVKKGLDASAGSGFGDDE